MRTRSHGSRFIRLLLAVSMLSGITGIAAVANAAVLTPLVEIVSADSSGVVHSGHASSPSLSDDARYIAFESSAQLDSADTDGGYTDVYRKDRDTGETILVSTSTGTVADNAYGPKLSDDGNFVLFYTYMDLVAGDTNGRYDVYVKDITAGTYKWLDFRGDGSGLSGIQNCAFSGDASTVVMVTEDVIAAGDGPSAKDVYAYDLATDTVTWVTEPTADTADTGRGSRDVDVSDDGRYVVFVSGKDFVAEDANGDQDIYVYDMDLDSFTWCDLRGDGSAAGDEVWETKISGDGSTVIFYADYSFVAEDVGHQADIYRYVPATGETTWLSQFSESTSDWDRGARSATVSDDGRWVTCFTGKDLAPEDDNSGRDLYLIDAMSLLQYQIDVWGDGSSLSSDTWFIDISGDGSTVAFRSQSSIVDADTNGNYDVYAVVNPFDLGLDTYTAQRNTVLTVPAASGVLANDVARSGQPLSITGPSTAAHGTVDIAADGSFTYTPDAGFEGSDSFQYYLTDGSAQGVGTALVEVVNTAPVAVNDTYSVQQDGYLYAPPLGLLANDEDMNGDALTATKLTNPANGTVTVSPDGSFTYAPNAGYVGSDSFTYKANDGQVDSPAGTVNISVNAGGSGPVSEVGAVFRFYNRLTGTHFYTYSTQERDAVLQGLRGTLIYEGVAFYVNPASDTAPLYRFYNRLTNSHFYTASAEEKARVQATLSGVFTYEGVGFNVSMESGPGKVAVYRFFNVRRGSHFYTASAAERDSVTAKWPTIYRYEGVAFYVTPVSAGPN